MKITLPIACRALVRIILMALCLVSGTRAARAGDARTADQVRAEVERLRKTDVAWREVQWRTCLLDGLQESQRTGKPLMLWIFIDRPIDDERC